jgi:hypothetical protein
MHVEINSQFVIDAIAKTIRGGIWSGVKRAVISADSGSSKDSEGPTTSRKLGCFCGTACSLATRGSNGLKASPAVGEPTVCLCRADVRGARGPPCLRGCPTHLLHFGEAKWSRCGEFGESDRFLEVRSDFCEKELSFSLPVVFALTLTLVLFIRVWRGDMEGSSNEQVHIAVPMITVKLLVLLL